jgi:RNA polymerase sigma-70 factor (ECF subfamily)
LEPPVRLGDRQASKGCVLVLHATRDAFRDTQGREARLEDDPDEGLVRRVVAEGDESAFRVLFRRHTPALLSLATRLLDGDRSAGEDAVQEAWIRAVAGLGRFRGEARLRTWLCGFVVNCCRERRRSDARAHAVAVLREADVSAAAPGGDVDLERAIDALPEGYRSVLVLHDVVGYTHREIAQLVEIDEGTSKSQLFRARLAVRRRLGRGPGSEDSDD